MLTGLTVSVNMPSAQFYNHVENPHMQLMIDLDTETAQGLRMAATLLMNYAVMKDKQPAPATSVVAAIPEVPAPPSAPVTIVPPPPSNVLPFVPPPPTIPGVPVAAVPIAPAPVNVSIPAAGVTNASTAPATPPASNVPLEYDAAGMPWDARIHQKAKSRKKDGTWKLQKGIDQTLVQSVVSELAAKRLSPSAAPLLSMTAPLPATVVPPPPPVPLNALNEPFVPAVPPPPNVPPPPPADVPAPSPVDTSAVSGVTFRQLLDKITEGTKAGKLDPLKVAQIVQQHGAPNIMSLKGMAHLIPDVSASIDAALLGLA